MVNKSLKIIIVGATSGIGEALALHYLKQGHSVGITGRRLDKLKSLQQRFLGRVFIKQMDVTLVGQAVIQLDSLIDKMEGVDLIFLNAGTGSMNPALDWKIEQQSIDTNVTGFTALACTASNYFINQKSGHLVSISSINALRGSDVAPAYAASKSYISNYMQGLRKKAAKLKLPVYYTDVKPGFVDTEMAKGNGLFWVAPPRKAAAQIANAVNRKRKQVYITKRWRLIAWLIKYLPDWLYHKI